jgi:hypothetical protein
LLVNDNSKTLDIKEFIGKNALTNSKAIARTQSSRHAFGLILPSSCTSRVLALCRSSFSAEGE